MVSSSSRLSAPQSLALATLFFALSTLTMAPPPAAAASAAPAPGDEIPFEDLFSPDPPQWTASSLVWSSDGEALVYQLRDEEGKALWMQKAPRWEPKALLRLGEEEGQIESLGEVRWSPKGDQLILEHGGDLSRLDVASGTLRALTATAHEESDPKFSPDGAHLAFVRGGNLYVRSLADAAERQLTEDGDDETVLNGKTDWVYWEELWGRDSTGHWWSPDGTQLAYYRFEEEDVPAYPLVNFIPVYPEVEWQKYPKAGNTNPTVRVGVVATAGGETTWLETGDTEEWYLPRVHWVDEGKVAVERLNRGQNRLELLLCEVESGACKALITDRSDTWINVGDETRFLEDGRILWASERSGWKHLYLYSKEGREIRRLTDGDGDLTSLGAVDEEEGVVVVTRYQAGFLGAKDRQVERIPLDGGKSKVLSEGAGWHGATISGGGNWVHRWSDAENRDRWTIRSADGKTLATLPQAPAAEGDEGKPSPTLPAWRFFTIPGPEGVNLPAAILHPSGVDTEGSHPAIVYHYGGPQSQVVTNRWDGRGRQLWHRWMASRGYAVLMVDNRASDFFGKGGADRVHRRFGPTNLEAQLAGVEYLKSLEWVDVDRIGLWGWSGGGSNTLYCLLNAPGVFKAGVSGAPVTDWRFYDTIWTERYLDHPDDNEEGYRLSSAVTHAEKLEDHLLIVHGTADDNVHPHNTFAFIKTLIDEDIPFEDAIYPRQKHGFKRGPYLHFLRRMTEFFDRHLMTKE